MKDSTQAIFPAFYTAAETEASTKYIAHVDPMLINDGTYFVIEAGNELVACGGWSKRDKLFSGSADQEDLVRLLDPTTEAARVRAMFVRSDWTRKGLGTRILDACQAAARAEGFRRLSLMATLPGYELYLRYGFVAGERGPITLPDGTLIECIAMEMPIQAEWLPDSDGPT
ncbi:MAG: GNAT family N-acetyltransferase [Actinobacteria bacterium]|nr:GNAT family N-acetyltransferase [Actinomycetota bacterium]